MYKVTHWTRATRDDEWKHAGIEAYATYPYVGDALEHNDVGPDWSIREENGATVATRPDGLRRLCAKPMPAAEQSDRPLTTAERYVVSALYRDCFRGRESLLAPFFKPVVEVEADDVNPRKLHVSVTAQLAGNIVPLPATLRSFKLQTHRLFGGGWKSTDRKRIDAKDPATAFQIAGVQGKCLVDGVGSWRAYSHEDKFKYVLTEVAELETYHLRNFVRGSTASTVWRPHRTTTVDATSPRHALELAGMGRDWRVEPVLLGARARSPDGLTLCECEPA